MANLYTFGCSFSRYSWPMWPDILAQCYDKTENYGSPGVGNFYIFQQVLYCLSTQNISNKDTVIIQWTEPSRVDYVENNDWVNAGSLSAELLIKAELDFVISRETTAIKTLTYMSVLIDYLEKINCNWYFIFMSPECLVHTIELDSLKLSNHLKIRYQKNLDKLKKHNSRIIDSISMTDFFTKNGVVNNLCEWEVNNKLETFVDGHPLPIHTFKYINEIINKNLNLDLSKSDLFIKNLSTIINKYKIINTKNLSQEIDDFYKSNNFKKTVDGRY